MPGRKMCIMFSVAKATQHYMRGYGAAGSAPAWHAGGQGFESPYLHNFRRTRTPDIGGSRCWCEGGERLSELDRRPFVFADLDAVGERLVRQSLALIVGARVQGRAVYEQAERGAEVLA